MQDCQWLFIVLRIQTKICGSACTQEPLASFSFSHMVALPSQLRTIEVFLLFVCLFLLEDSSSLIHSFHISCIDIPSEHFLIFQRWLRPPRVCSHCIPCVFLQSIFFTVYNFISEMIWKYWWLVFFLFEMESPCSVTQAVAIVQSQHIATFASWVQAILLPQPPE